MAASVVIIDYGMGNLHSVTKAIEHVAPNVKIEVTSDAKRVAMADRVILPGVGAMRDCMAEILKQGVDKEVNDTILAGKPFLGICVGMQALMQYSEENNGVDCLAEIKGNVCSFDSVINRSEHQLKIPHMGWNKIKQNPHPLWKGIADNSYFYFVHSYYVKAENQNDVAAQCSYGLTFDAALAKDNIFAVQFHPEKSAKSGLQLLQNFIEWDGNPE